jgi:hypothetical protein
MAERMFEYDSRVATLKKKYFKKFNRVLPALTSRNFFKWTVASTCWSI